MEEATIGQYRVTGLIGRGGMGAVYAAEHALLGRPAAIKVLLPELSQKQDVVQRFFNEARAATAIRHPGIIEVYDFGWTPEGDAFIVMERLEGETLARRASRALLRWPAVLAIARQIAGALSAAHAKGIVHRDLKPDNVFLVPDPEVPGGERIKLLDFGIAKLAVDPSTTASVTKTGALMGTPTYMAPEQCRGVAVDHRADLYALGCVMYELCCGLPPFVGEGSGDVLAAHIHVPVPRMTGRRSEFPAALEKLIRRLLAKAPAERVQSAEALIQAIDALTAEHTTTTSGARRPILVPSSPSVTTLSGTASMTMPAQTARRRWPVVAVSGALAALTVAVVIVAMRPAAPVPAAAVPVVPVPAAPVPVAPAPVAPAPVAPAPVAPAAPAMIDVAIDSAPSGAQVLIDGAAQGTTPFHGSIERGDREVALVIRLAGYADRTIVAHADQPISERVALERKPVAAHRPTPAAKPAAPAAKSPKTDRNRSVNPF